MKEALPFNLLVAFLTGEESGLWGAKHLIANPPAPISAAINLDCIGNEARPFTFQLGHKQPGDWLAGLAEDILLKRGIQTKWAGGRDDSAAFSAKKIPTVGLLQQYTQVRNILHTPLDTFESIHLETIQEGIEILLEIVKSISETQYKEKKMSTQTEKPKDNLLVKLVKKSVGLPTSDCCGTAAQEQEAESGSSEQPSAARSEQSTSTAATSDCGCGGMQGQEAQSENQTE